MGLTVLSKMQCQNNTDNQIMMKKITITITITNVCLPLLYLSPNQGGGNNFTGGGQTKFVCEAENILPPPLEKTFWPSLYLSYFLRFIIRNIWPSLPDP